MSNDRCVCFGVYKDIDREDSAGRDMVRGKLHLKGMDIKLPICSICVDVGAQIHGAMKEAVSHIGQSSDCASTAMFSNAVKLLAAMDCFKASNKKTSALVKEMHGIAHEELLSRMISDGGELTILTKEDCHEMWKTWKTMPERQGIEEKIGTSRSAVRRTCDWQSDLWRQLVFKFGFESGKCACTHVAHEKDPYGVCSMEGMSAPEDAQSWLFADTPPCATCYSQPDHLKFMSENHHALSLRNQAVSRLQWYESTISTIQLKPGKTSSLKDVLTKAVAVATESFPGSQDELSVDLFGMSSFWTATFLEHGGEAKKREKVEEIYWQDLHDNAEKKEQQEMRARNVQAQTAAELEAEEALSNDTA